MANSYHSDFGTERSGVKGSLPSPGAGKYLEGTSWLHWLLGRLPWRKHEKLFRYSQDMVSEHMI